MIVRDDSSTSRSNAIRSDVRRLLIHYDGRDYNILYVNTYGDEGKYMEFWCERITQEGKV